MTKPAMPTKRQTDKKQPKLHKMRHPIILSAIGLTLLLLLAIIIYPKTSAHSEASSDVSAFPQQDSPSQPLRLSPPAQAPVVDPWLNGFNLKGFGYRKPISNAGSALTDFQVNVTPYIYNETGLVGSWHFSESGGRTTALTVAMQNYFHVFGFYSLLGKWDCGPF